MATFRITYRMEVYVTADTQAEAQDIFDNKVINELVDESTFVEQSTIDEEKH